MKTIILVIAFTGYQPIEYGEPKRILMEKGFHVVTASDALGQAIAKDGTTTTVDMIITDIIPESADALYIIGGPGALDHLDTSTMHTILQTWAASGKPYGAICISPRILARAGVLKGKKATGWNEDSKLQEIFAMYDVTYMSEPVVVDAGVVTADSPQSAVQFGEEIIKILQ